MPNRKEFLDTGLVPLATRSEGELECTVCSNALDKPVRLPCDDSHAFCEKCIRDWLDAPGNNTCPLCRSQLFEIDDLERIRAENQQMRAFVDQLDQVENRSIYANVDEGERLSGLRTQPVAELDTFGLGEFSEEALTQAINDAVGYVRTMQDLRLQSVSAYFVVRGTGLVALPSLLPSLIAMANLVPALACAAGRRYSSQEAEDWRLIVTALGAMLVRRGDRKVRNARTLPDRLIERLRTDEMTDAYVAETEFLTHFLPDGSVSWLWKDFREFLHFVAFAMWNDRLVKDEEKKRQRQERGGCVVM